MCLVRRVVSDARVAVQTTVRVDQHVVPYGDAAVYLRKVAYLAVFAYLYAFSYVAIVCNDCPVPEHRILCNLVEPPQNLMHCQQSHP